MNVSVESPDQAEVIALIAALDAYQDTLYPPESRYALDLGSLKQSNVLFAVARDAAQRAIGCGAVVMHAAHGELKRMYVAPEARGKGAARAILALLETRATATGCRLLRLETGPYQPAALRLYEACGYQRCGAFAPYRDDPLSVFMHKTLGPERGAGGQRRRR
jgi:putative acetyltransferase